MKEISIADGGAGSRGRVAGGRRELPPATCHLPPATCDLPPAIRQRTRDTRCAHQLRCSSLHDPYASLRSPDFRRILFSYATATVAREAQIVVVGWQVYAQTGDPLTLGMIGLAEALPYIGVALYAGHLADRATRRTIALAGTFGIFLSAIALLLFTLG